jgi:hypothetical protein
MKAKYFAIISVTLIGIGFLSFLLWQSQKITVVKVLNHGDLMYPFWTLEDNGIFKENKLKFETVELPDSIKSSQDWNTANYDFEKWMVEEGPDAGVVSLDNLFNIEALSPGKYKAFAFVSDSDNSYMTNIIVSADSSLNSYKDLSGKTISTNINDIDQLLLSEYMKTIKVDDYKPLKITKDKVDDYLINNKSSAVWVTEPQASQLISDNKAKSIVKNPINDIEGDLSNSIYRVFVIKTEFVDSNKKAVNNLIKSFKSLPSVNDIDIRNIIVNRLGLSQKEATDMRTFPKIDFSDSINKDQLNIISSMLFDNKYIDKKIDINNIIF